MPDRNALDVPFYCPLCRSNHYEFVTVGSSKDRSLRAVDGLFQCAGCSVVFTDPDVFKHLVDRPH